MCARCGGDVSGEGSGRVHSVRLSLAAARMRPPTARTHATHADLLLPPSPPFHSTRRTGVAPHAHTRERDSYMHAEPCTPTVIYTCIIYERARTRTSTANNTCNSSSTVCRFARSLARSVFLVEYRRAKEERA